MERKYLDAKGVMKQTGLGRNTVYAMFNIPSFPATRVGKRIIVAEDALYAWLDRGGTEQKETARGGRVAG